MATRPLGGVGIVELLPVTLTLSTMLVLSVPLLLPESEWLIVVAGDPLRNR